MATRNKQIKGSEEDKNALCILTQGNTSTGMINGNNTGITADVLPDPHPIVTK